MDLECIICTNNILPFELYKFTPCCINIFHSKCLNEWYSYKFICPNCRYNLNDIESATTSNEPFEDIPSVTELTSNRNNRNNKHKIIIYIFVIILPISCVIGILFLLLFIFLN